MEDGGGGTDGNRDELNNPEGDRGKAVVAVREAPKARRKKKGGSLARSHH